MIMPFPHECSHVRASHRMDVELPLAPSSVCCCCCAEGEVTGVGDLAWLLVLRTAPVSTPLGGREEAAEDEAACWICCCCCCGCWCSLVLTAASALRGGRGSGKTGVGKGKKQEEAKIERRHLTFSSLLGRFLQLCCTATVKRLYNFGSNFVSSNNKKSL